MIFYTFFLIFAHLWWFGGRGFQLMWFGACGVGPSGVLGFEALYINIEEYPWEKTFPTEQLAVLVTECCTANQTSTECCMSIGKFQIRRR